MFFFLYSVVMISEAGASAETPRLPQIECARGLGRLLDRFIPFKHPPSSAFQLSSGPLLWNLGERPRRSDVQELANSVAIDLMYAATTLQPVRDIVIPEIERISLKIGIVPADHISRQSETTLEALRQSIEKLPADNDDFLQLTETPLLLSELGDLLYYPVKKSIYIRKLPTGAIALLVGDGNFKDESLRDVVFGVGRRFWHPRVWRNAPKPVFQYPGRYSHLVAGVDPLSLSEVIRRLKNKLRPFGMKTDNVDSGLQEMFYRTANENFLNLQLWPSQLPAGVRAEIPFNDLVSWLTSRKIIFGKANAKEYLATQMHYTDQSSAIYADRFPALDQFSNINTRLSIPLFDGSINLSVRFELESPRSFIEEKWRDPASDPEFVAKVTYELNPSLDSPLNAYPSDAELNQLIQALFQTPF